MYAYYRLVYKKTRLTDSLFFQATRHDVFDRVYIGYTIYRVNIFCVQLSQVSLYQVQPFKSVHYIPVPYL